MRRAPSPKGLSVGRPRKRFSSGLRESCPQLATSPSRRVSISPRTWMSTSVGPIPNPPSRDGMESLRVVVYSASALGSSTSGASFAAEDWWTGSRPIGIPVAGAVATQVLTGGRSAGGPGSSTAGLKGRA